METVVYKNASPVQVLTKPDPAELPRSDEIRCVKGGMDVDCFGKSKFSTFPFKIQDQFINIYLQKRLMIF